MSKTINQLVTEAHETAKSKGWYEKPLEFGTAIALMHSELSEALEAYRNNQFENVPEELADVCIRIFDTCGFYGIDLEFVINEKMAKNKDRPYKHGGKKI